MQRFSEFADVLSSSGVSTAACASWTSLIVRASASRMCSIGCVAAVSPRCVKYSAATCSVSELPWISPRFSLLIRRDSSWRYQHPPRSAPRTSTRARTGGRLTMLRKFETEPLCMKLCRPNMKGWLFV